MVEVQHAGPGGLQPGGAFRGFLFALEFRPRTRVRGAALAIREHLTTCVDHYFVHIILEASH